jgi:hypothetical protein
MELYIGFHQLFTQITRISVQFAGMKFGGQMAPPIYNYTPTSRAEGIILVSTYVLYPIRDAIPPHAMELDGPHG